MKNISIFKNFSKVLEDKPVTQILETIRNGKYKDQVTHLRQCLLQGKMEDYERAKKNLPAFTPSGRFSDGRKQQHLQEYTSLLVLDLDKLNEEQLQESKSRACSVVYTYAAFISPSGNGLKILVQVKNGSMETHKQAFNEVKAHYEKLLNIKIDESGCDVTRLCFLSWDENLYVNEATEAFPITDYVQVFIGAEKPPLPNFTGKIIEGNRKTSIAEMKVEDLPVIYQQCIELTGRKYNYTEGSRNSFVYQLACNMNRCGVAAEDTLNFILSDYGYNKDEVSASVKSAYANIHEFGTMQKLRIKFADKPKSLGSGLSNRNKSNVQNLEKDPINEIVAASCFAGNDSVEIVNSSQNTAEDHSPPAFIDKIEAFLLDRYRFRYNIVTSRQEYCEVHSNNWKQLTDRAESSLLRELQKGHLKVSGVMLRSLLGSDFCPLFDPFESYFKSLPNWDEETDFIAELASTVTTTDQEQWFFCFKRWLVAMVAGVLDDKTVNHTLIVLSGGQGLGKTTWVQNLMPKPLRHYIFSGEIKPGNKDAMQQISENMLINLDELENLNRTEIGALKEIVTKSEIKVRKAYGHHHEKMPRRASFAGSVNSTQFLNDSTGSRRFLCFEVEDINYKHKINLDTVYAQAYYLYKNGFRFWFDKEEIKQITTSNERFQMRSAEEELLLTWFELPDATKSKSFLTTSQIASKLASVAKINVTDATIRKLGSALRKHGFERVKKKNVYGYLVHEFSWEEVERKSKTKPEECTEIVL